MEFVDSLCTEIGQFWSGVLQIKRPHLKTKSNRAELLANTLKTVEKAMKKN